MEAVITRVEKINQNEFEITKQSPTPAPEVIKYDYDFLLKQRNTIQAELDDYTAKRQAELDEVNDLIQRAEDAGCTSSVSQVQVK